MGSANIAFFFERPYYEVPYVCKLFTLKIEVVTLEIVEA